MNAVKTAVNGGTVLLPGDDADEYDRHIQAFANEYSPVGAREADLVRSIAYTWFAQGHLEFAGCFEEHDPYVRPSPSLILAQTFLKYEKQLRNSAVAGSPPLPPPDRG